MTLILMVHQVRQTIQRATFGCGTGLVRCNDEEEEEPEDVTATAAVNDVIDAMSGSHRCQGAVELMHWASNNRSNRSTLTLRGTSFSNIRRLQNRQVLPCARHATLSKLEEQ